MPTETKEIPTKPDVPIQNVEDPGKVDQIFKEAAKKLEYAKEPAPPPADITPETEPAPETPKKPVPKAKAKEPESTPKIESAPPPEPKKSKRELFKEKADAEKAYRDKEAKLKEREAATQKREADLQRLEVAFREFQADPISYLEKQNPRAYEEWTQRNLTGGKPKENTEISVLKSEIEKLREEIKGKYEETTNQVTQAQYIQYMSEAHNILTREEYKPVQESAALFEEFTGNPVDMDRAIASVWAEYKSQYGKELTAKECCEILLEDAQAHLENVPKSQRLKALFGKVEVPAEKKKKPSPQPSGRTLTNEQETTSAPAPEVDLSKIKSKDQLLVEASKLLEYEEPAEQ